MSVSDDQCCECMDMDEYVIQWVVNCECMMSMYSMLLMHELYEFKFGIVSMNSQLCTANTFDNNSDNDSDY